MSLRRREFVVGLGGAAAWPLAAKVQQRAMPVIGFLHSQSPDGVGMDVMHGFRQGLNETGFVEGENLTIEYRWAENQFDRRRRQGGVPAAWGEDRMDSPLSVERADVICSD